MSESECKSASACAHSALNTVYQMLATSGSVPPAYRFRAEGCLQALLALDLLTRTDMLALIELVYRDTFEADLFSSNELREQCIALDANQVRLPVLMARAPVYPTTSD